MSRKSVASYIVVAGIAAAVTAGFSQFGGPGLSAAQALNATAPQVNAPLGVASRSLPDIATLVEQNGPAVVNIKVSGMSKTANDLPEELKNSPFGEFFRRFGVPGQQGPQGQGMPTRGEGSGFIVSADGVVLTNAHVVAEASKVTVRLTDGRELEAKVIGVDKKTDVAVLRIDAKGLPTVKIGNPAATRVGEWVVAIGSPYGFENSVTAGIVSAKSRSLPEENYVPFIQTDAAVNPGNSGGPLFNLAGEVIGINSQIYSRSGGFQGISFAIPIEVALNVKDQLVKHGKVTRGRMGVTVQEVNATLADSFSLDRPRGALISAVEAGSPAEKAGMQVGDIILKYNGATIERSSDLPVLVADTAPGKTASVDVWRKGSSKTLTVATFEGKPKAEQSASNEPKGAATGRLGLAVRPLTPEERKENNGRAGLVIEEVAGAAARAGLQPGDLVLSLNGNAVTTPDDLRDHAAKAGKRVALLIQREGQQLFVPIELG